MLKIKQTREYKMKTKYYLFLLLACQVLAVSPTYAKVQFIIKETEDANSTKGKNIADDLASACAQKGFPIKASSCTGFKQAGLLCPLSADYTDKCCNVEYAYTLPGSCNDGTSSSSDTCGGRYRCICNPIAYPKGPGRESCTGKFSYDEVNYCTETYYDDSGTLHQTRYFKGCMCSSSYARCNTSHHLHGVGEGCAYNGNTYYTSCACDSGYNKRCISSGAKYPHDYCLFNGNRYYTVCNSEEANDKSDSDTMNSTDQ